MKKYELTENYIIFDGRKLFQIKALISFGDVKPGDLGGYIEKEGKLSHCGNEWVFGHAMICGNTMICDNAVIFGNAVICGNVNVSGNANICGNAAIQTNKDYTYIRGFGSEYRTTTFFRLDNKDITYVQEQYDMSKKKDLLHMHKWSISQGSDGFWRTYLPDKNCKNERRMIKKHTKKEVEDIVIEYYKRTTEKPKTFDDAYYKWRSFKNEMISDNSISKYNTDYNRYFKGTKFAQTDITDITEEDIQVFIVKTVKQKKLCKKACKTLFGYISNTFRSAVINKIIEDNPTENLQASQFYKYCIEVEKTQEQKLVSDQDMELLYQRFYEDYKKHPEYIPTYAVHMATLTGMRVGELAALKWQNITNDYIIINMSEKYNRITKEYFIDSTKNQKDRVFPLTDELRELLSAVKKVEMQNGFLSEWVFSNRSGRIHASVISSCSKNKCRQIGISEKGIHAYRRTINSKMRCNGVSSVVAASLLGHSPEVNQKYYTFDISSIKEKTDIVSNITRNMPIAK